MPGGYCRPRFCNHHCDPELFDNYLKEGVLQNDGTDSLILSTDFNGEIQDRPEVVYVFRDVSNAEKMQYREFPLSDLIGRFGKRPPTEPAAGFLKD